MGLPDDPEFAFGCIGENAVAFSVILFCLKEPKEVAAFDIGHLPEQTEYLRNQRGLLQLPLRVASVGKAEFRQQYLLVAVPMAGHDVIRFIIVAFPQRVGHVLGCV